MASCPFSPTTIVSLAKRNECGFVRGPMPYSVLTIVLMWRLILPWEPPPLSATHWVKDLRTDFARVLRPLEVCTRHCSEKRSACERGLKKKTRKEGWTDIDAESADCCVGLQWAQDVEEGLGSRGVEELVGVDKGHPCVSLAPAFEASAVELELHLLGSAMLRGN